MKKFFVRVCVCVNDTDVRDYTAIIEANNVQQVYEKLQDVKFEGEVTKVEVREVK